MNKADDSIRKSTSLYLPAAHRGSARPCSHQLEEKEEYWDPAKWLEVDCNIYMPLPEVSISPIRLFWVSSFNELI